MLLLYQTQVLVIFNVNKNLINGQISTLNTGHLEFKVRIIIWRQHSAWHTIEVIMCTLYFNIAGVACLDDKETHCMIIAACPLTHDYTDQISHDWPNKANKFKKRREEIEKSINNVKHTCEYKTVLSKSWMVRFV